MSPPGRFVLLLALARLGVAQLPADRGDDQASCIVTTNTWPEDENLWRTKAATGLEAQLREKCCAFGTACYNYGGAEYQPTVCTTACAEFFLPIFRNCR